MSNQWVCACGLVFTHAGALERHLETEPKHYERLAYVVDAP